MSTSVRKENRWRKQLWAENDARDKLRREMEIIGREQTITAKTKSSKPKYATKAQVRQWMRENWHEYENPTFLAEAANVTFELPNGGLDNETHWVWDLAADCYEDC